MKRGATGKYETTIVGGERIQAFVPAPLPPMPPLVVDGPLQLLLEKAVLALGRLDGVSKLLPDVGLFLYGYVRKEAVLSSQIEGTQSSLSDLLLFELDEIPGVPIEDVTEVSNYVAALEHGMERIRGGFPISSRLIREMHERLLAKGRGSGKEPGEFRRSQNWIGGTRPGNAVFVPPPHVEIAECIAALERFIHDEAHALPLLIRAALAHVQFETIHPFLDGNGRVGRLLITLLLCDGALSEPLLYLSLYLKQHRSRYYELLDAVRRDGDWESWIEFFLEGVRTTAEEAADTATRLTAIFAEDHERVAGIGRKSSSALRVHEALKQRPLLSLAEAARRTSLSFPAASSGMTTLANLGIAQELTGRRRNRVFAYRRYLDALTSGE